MTSDGFDEIDDYAERSEEEFGKRWREQRELVDALLKVDSGLQDWEVALIEGCSRSLSRDGVCSLLSVAREGKLHAIAMRLEV